MTQFLFANNASTTLASAVAPTDTVIQVASGSGSEFPNPLAGQQFAVTFQDAATGLIEEIAYCTAISGDNLIVVRGREGTVSRAWAVGDNLSNYWTAGSAAAFVQLPTLQAQATNFATDSGTANALSANLNPAITAYSQIVGSPIRLFKNSATNTGNVTLTLNGLGPLPLVMPGGAQIPSGLLFGSSLLEVAYDGSRFELLSVGAFSPPGGPAGGDLAGTYPNPVVAPNKIDNGKLGQMPGLTVKGNPTGSLGNPQDITFTALMTLLNITSDSGSLRVGPVLIQWGVSGPHNSNFSIALPHAYANGNYSIQMTGGMSTSYFGIIPNVSGTPTTGGFNVDLSGASSGTATGYVHWVTIGIGA